MSEIQRSGPMTFARFMELALYDPEVGYYMSPSDGSPNSTQHSGLRTQDSLDYVTSPEVHGAFGVLLCAQFEEMWRYLGEPEPFWLIEGGAGSGALAAQILVTAGRAFPRFAQALQIALIEASPARRARAVARVAPSADRVHWLDASPAGWPAAGVGPGCVFANELLDAFPVHRIVMRADRLHEVYVAVEEGALREVEGPPSTPALEAQIEAGGGRLAVGQRGEVNLAAPAWVQAAAGLIDRGYLLLLDYGDPADELYGPGRPRGTLRCYWRHTMNEGPLTRVGLQDITAHVDFSAVTRAALLAGLPLVGATRQAKLLGRLGLPLLDEAAAHREMRRAQQRAHRASFRALADPSGLGRVLAVAYAKAAPAAPLAGFTRSTPALPPEVPEMWGLA